MRTVFNINVRADVHENDPVTRAAFEVVLKDIGESIYSQVAIMSKGPPLMKITITDEEYGEVEIPLFTEEYTNE